MFDSIFLILVGAFIGWHIPEPFWAKIIKNKLIDLINKAKPN